MRTPTRDLAQARAQPRVAHDQKQVGFVPIAD